MGFDSMKMPQSPKQSGSPSSSRSSSPHLSPLQSPAEQGSHADQLEEMLLADMEADDKWAVASNKAPRCPRKSAGDDGAIPGPSGTNPPSAARGIKRLVEGEEGLLAEMVMKIEDSREVGEAGEGWSETHSQQAVEELHEWLLQGNDSVAAPPPPYGRKDRAKTSPPSSTTTRVEELSRKSGGIPRHVAEQRDCEERFKILTFIAIEPFSEEGMEWDGGEASPSPLLPMAQWPRKKGHKVRFNPRCIEGSDEDLPSPRIEEDQSTSRQGDTAAELPETPPVDEGREAVTDATPAEGHPEPTPPGAFVFRRLRHRTHRDFSSSPDRFPSFRGSITRGILFGGLRSIPTDTRDPPHGSCFNCRKGGHTRFDYREPPPLLFQLREVGYQPPYQCPRCGEAHLEYLRAQEDRWNRHPPGRESRGPAERPAVPRRQREVAPTPRLSRDRPPRRDTPERPEQRRLESQRREQASSGPREATGSAGRPPAAASRDIGGTTRTADATGNGVTTPQPSGTTLATPRPTLLEYFASLQHLPGDLQETLLRAFLAQ